MHVKAGQLPNFPIAFPSPLRHGSCSNFPCAAEGSSSRKVCSGCLLGMAATGLSALMLTSNFGVDALQSYSTPFMTLCMLFDYSIHC